jgi:hypothetical protein
MGIFLCNQERKGWKRLKFDIGFTETLLIQHILFYESKMDLMILFFNLSINFNQVFDII